MPPPPVSQKTTAPELSLLTCMNHIKFYVLRPRKALGHDSSGSNKVIPKKMFALSADSNTVLYRHGYSFVSDPLKTPSQSYQGLL